MTAPRTLALLVLISLVAAACSSTGESSDPASEQAETSASESTPSPTSTTTPPEPTDLASTDDAITDDTATDSQPIEVSGPVGEQLAWVADVLGRPAPGETEIAEAPEHLDPSFLQQVPAEAFVGLIPQITQGATGPWQVTGGEFTDFAGQARLTPASGDPLLVSIRVDEDPPHLILELLASPVPEPPTDVSGLDAQITQLGEAAVGIYEVTDGSCEPLHELNGDEALGQGSGFKLWILAGLGQAVADGTASWDETLAIRDEYRSTPDGELYSLPTGEEVSLQRVAELMISISDNTATDHLLYRLGREAVEDAVVASGVADPARNIPMMSTGELFQLKFIPGPPNAADLAGLGTQDRRAVLDEIRDSTLAWVGSDDVPTTNAEGETTDQPRNLDIEWFGSPRDMCATMVHLDGLASMEGLEPIAEILSINAGAGLDLGAEGFSEIRFKGGSEPGVLAGNWWVERPDGRQFVVAGAVNNPNTAFSSDQAIIALGAGITFLQDLAPS